MSRRILVVCEDIFFWAKIHAAASAKGHAAVRIGDEGTMQAAFQEGGVHALFVDLGAQALDIHAWVARWKSLENAPHVIGFVSHVDIDAQRRAREAGFDEVLARSRFSERLADLV
jgi:DNA-binding response OmpR family regulator